MKPERIELLPGVFFNRIPVDIFKMSRLSLFFSVPLCDEPSASRLALLPSVLRQGTEAYPTAAAIVRRQEELYSADLGTGVFKAGDNQVLVFSVDYIRQSFVPDGSSLLRGAVELLSGMLFAPHIDRTTGVFSDEYVEREKKNACDRIRSLQNNKALYALRRCVSLMCEREAYGIAEYGTVEETEKITPASLYAAYRALLASAHIEIFFTGTETEEELLPLLLPSLERLHRHPIALPKTAVRYRAEKKRQIAERAVAQQGRLCLGFRSGVAMQDSDAPVFSLFHTLYGASPTSKLFVNVREKLSLCYSCSSTAHMMKGVFFVSAGIENASRRRALREIFRQLSRMRAGRITEREMSMGKRSLINQLRSIMDEPAAIERWYFNRALLGLSQSPEEYAEALSAVTVKDVARIAKGVTADTVYFLRAVAESTGEEEGYEL